MEDLLKLKNRVLIIGSGGREHAITLKFAASPQVSHIWVAPGNGGTAKLQNAAVIIKNIDLRSNEEIAAFSKSKNIDLVVIGPEVPLANGLSNLLASIKIPCFGPSKASSRIEADKVFAKDFMKRHGIPTAHYSTFSDAESALKYLDEVYSIDDGHRRNRIVIKASGLAAGKGVILPVSKLEAQEAVIDILNNRVFGDAGNEIVIEEYLEGREASILAFSDGTTVVPMIPAQDYKRIHDGGLGLNTGGMGAIASNLIVEESIMNNVLTKVLQPAISGLKAEGIPFVGVLFAGIMISNNKIYCLEFNCRFGDPETQVVLPLLKTDLFQIALSCVNGTLSSQPVIFDTNNVSVTVVLASKGYPESPEKGKSILIRENIPYVQIYHSGTKLSGSELLTNGGRVLCVTVVAPTIKEAVHRVYSAIPKISFSGMQYRNDIALNYLPKLRIAVLGSTRGTDLKAIIDAIESGSLSIELKLVISNVSGAYILERAKNYPTLLIEKKKRLEFEKEVVRAIENVGGVDLILCIGFMRIISSYLLEKFENRIINVHPSLLPDFAGGMDLDVHEKVLQSAKTESGCTVHIVSDLVDQGEILVQKRCSIDLGETPDSLKAKVQNLEGIALIEAIHLYQHGIIPSRNSHATYLDAGVDINKGNSLVQRIKPFCKETKRPGADAVLGGFGGLFDMAALHYKDPILVSGTDGVGTKLIFAIQNDKNSGIGQDLVAMCVNDILVQGAEPLFFLDYFASSNLELEKAVIIIKGISKACKEVGCALIGGETAEMPGLYKSGDYDIAGFSVGVVERSKILPKLNDIQEGDVIVGLASSGLHSNGYSLVRMLLEKNKISVHSPPPYPCRHSTILEDILTPTYLYVSAVLPILKAGLVKGAANITGGGLTENIPRTLPPHLCANLDVKRWECTPIIKWLADMGNMETEEVLRTWNTGIGLILISDPQHASEIIARISEISQEFSPRIIGNIIKSGDSGAQIVYQNKDLLLKDI